MIALILALSTMIGSFPLASWGLLMTGDVHILLQAEGHRVCVVNISMWPDFGYCTLISTVSMFCL